MKKTYLFVASALTLACSAALAATGTYEGKAMGHNAEIDVAVTLDNNKITSVKILKNF